MLRIYPLIICECSPIFSNAIPIRTAKKMSCIMLESKNGFTKFAGMIPTSVSLIEILTSETDTVAASPASFAASSGLPGFNNSNTPCCRKNCQNRGKQVKAHDFSTNTSGFFQISKLGNAACYGEKYYRALQSSSKHSGTLC